MTQSKVSAVRSDLSSLQAQSGAVVQDELKSVQVLIEQRQKEQRDLNKQLEGKIHSSVQFQQMKKRLLATNAKIKDLRARIAARKS